MKKNIIIYLGLFLTTWVCAQNTNILDRKEAELLNSASLVYSAITSQDTQIQDYYRAKNLFKNKQYKAALTVALKIKDQIKDPELYGKCNLLIGAILKENKNFKRAIQYLKVSDSLFVSLKNKSIIAKNSQLLASSFLQLYINDTLDNRSLLDKSLLYFNRAIYNYGDSTVFLKEKAVAYSDLSTLFSLKKDILKTKKYASIAIASFKKLKEEMAIEGYFFVLRMSFFKENKVDKSLYATAFSFKNTVESP